MYLNSESENKKLKFNVLEYAAKAKNAKTKDKTVINASIGMLYENEQVYRFNTVINAANKIPISKCFSYGSSSGSLEYRNMVTDYFLENQVQKHKTCIMTNGGTGAVYLAIKNYCPKTLVIPNISWGNYSSMAKELGKKVVYYDFFKDNKFNIKGCIDCFKNQEKIFLLLNTPAHNPTGYTIKNTELIELYKAIAKTKKPAIICFDIAYMDYANRELLSTFDSFKGLILVAASFSKSMGIYGMRAGALMALSDDDKVLHNFDVATLFTARTTYSLCNRYVEKLVIEVLKNQDSLKAEINATKKILDEKIAFFQKKATENNIDYLPCDEGFFILIDLGNTDINTLTNNGIYLLPIDKYYRVSISAISKKEISELINRLKEVMTKKERK